MILAGVQDHSDDLKWKKNNNQHTIHYTCSCYYSKKARAIPSQRSLCVLACAQGQQHRAGAVLCIKAGWNQGLIFWAETLREPIFMLCRCVLFMALWTLELVHKLSLPFPSSNRLCSLQVNKVSWISYPCFYFILHKKCSWKRPEMNSWKGFLYLSIKQEGG